MVRNATVRQGIADDPRVSQVDRETDLAVLILADVERSACGRIRDLSVACSGGRVTLRGRSRTQYAKQMAQQAVLDLDDAPALLSNRIEVG